MKRKNEIKIFYDQFPLGYPVAHSVADLVAVVVDLHSLRHGADPLYEPAQDLFMLTFFKLRVRPHPHLLRLL